LSFVLRQISLSLQHIKKDMGKKIMAKNETLLKEKDSLEAKDILILISEVKAGIPYTKFVSLAGTSPFSLEEWSGLLHISPRTMQRHKKRRSRFSSTYTEKIFQVTLLSEKGVDVFGDKEKYNLWLDTQNLALGKKRPKELLDTSFGIGLVTDELTRIEYGVFA
jgi:putative toxin-antitoxin system antitoxin component (TIGR02293 family)